MLTEARAVQYLLEQQILTQADVVQGGLLVHDVSRRNRNFTFRTNDGAGYFLKQSDIRQSSKTLHREAEIYRLLWMSEPGFASRHMPRLLWFDLTEELLVLDYLDSVEPLSMVQPRDSNLPIACAAELGHALGRLHNSQLAKGCNIEAPSPWIFSVEKPGRKLFTDFSSSAIFVIQIIQRVPNFGALLSGLSRSYEPSTPIHGDIRWDNCLVRMQEGSEAPKRFFIVDWELAGYGDPCWDVGGVFCEYLNLWIRSLPVTPSLSLEDSLNLAAYPLNAVQLRLTAFWNSYSQERSNLGHDRAFLLRAIQLSGARLVQSAVESAQASAQLTSTVVYNLQLAENIIRNPRRAGICLLQLPIT
jgi:thiamine kinase-like enzyme